MSIQSIQWIDFDNGSPFSKHTLSDLTKSYMDVEDPIPVLEKIRRLSDFLLLSNHINQAQDLITAVYTIAPDLVQRHTPRHLDVFWETHPTLTRPANAHPFSPPPGSLDTYIARWLRGEYHESTHTDVILNGREIPDPSIWRHSDDPEVLAMCARLLANPETPGTYPHKDKMREALAAGQKLFTQPQVPINEWKWASLDAPKRHSALLNRWLVINWAIRVGEPQTAVDLLSQALRLDGLQDWNSGPMEELLIVPGIYDILPLLAEGGKASNPFFITEEDAEVMVSEITKTLKQRAEHGRDWALAEDKVGWRGLLDRLAQAAWKVNGKAYRKLGVKSAEGILYDPATEEEIEAAEKKVGELPADFKEMVRIANGFRGGHDLFGGGIAGIQNIATSDDTYNFDLDLAELGMKERETFEGEIIELQPGSECDDFAHYIAPAAVWKQNISEREVGDGEYRYWYWAWWQGQINSWATVRDYVASCVEEVEEMVEKGEEADFEDSEGDEDRKKRKIEALKPWGPSTTLGLS